LRHYLIGLVLLFVIAGGSGAWYASVQAKGDALADAGQDASFGARLAAKQVGEDLATLRATVQQMAATPGVAQAFGRPRECSLSFAAPHGATGGPLDLVRTDASVACSSRPVSTSEGDYAGAAWLRQAAPAAALTAPTSDRRTGHEAVVATAPVPGVGVVAAFLDLDGLGDALAEFFGGPRHLEFLVATGDAATILTRSPDPAGWIGKPLAGTPFAVSARSTEGTDVVGTRRVYGQATVEGLGWRVYAGASRGQALAAARRLTQRHGLIVGAGLVAGLLATLLVYRRITRPIARLSGAVRTATATTGGPPVTVDGPREVAALGDDFNDLVAAVNHELVERRRAEDTARDMERNYRQLFDRNPYPMYVFDPGTLAIIDVNDAAVAYYGYSRDPFRTMGVAGLCLPEDVPALTDAIATAGNVERWRALRQVKRDGTVTEANVTSHVLSFAGRKARCAIVEDVTERAELERRLHQSQRLESLGQLAGGVAHDFNNLLAIILGYATMAADDVEAAARTDESWRALHGDLAQIIQAGDRATSLIRQLLSFARVEVTQPRVLDLNAVVTDVEQLLRRSIGADINLHTNLTGEPWRVTADPGQVEQVLVNLAVNARDAMPVGGTLTIETDNLTVDEHYAAHHPGTRPGRYLRLRVSDTGSGMSQATLDRAFEPFFTTKPKGHGTGLGLATIYGIITQAGGHAQMYSERGIGTTFSAMLPVTDEPAEISDTPTPRSHPGHGETILLVEDEDSLRALTERMLTRYNYTVITADGGAEALRVADQLQRVDLLLTDVVMPEMNGHDLATRLQARRPDLPVIYLSGYAEAVLVSRSTLPAGATLLSKPVSQHQLLAVIRRALDARERHARQPTG
jgi:PAS domain S-box-containing protein